MGENGEQVGPRGVNTVVNDQIVVIDGHIEQMVQPHGLERSLQNTKMPTPKGPTLVSAWRSVSVTAYAKGTMAAEMAARANTAKS